MFRRLSRLAMLCLCLMATTPAWGQTSLTQLATGLTQPVFATSPAGDTNRVFIVEQGVAAGSANIKVMNLSTNAVSTYMTITGLACCSERGLLGMAFHPDFATNGFFYTYQSIPGGGNHTSIVRRYTATGDPLTSNTANVASMQPVLSFSQPFSNHNGGWIGFNPNISGSDAQYLYIASGDGGSANDPGNRAQDITNQWLGKMLRVDVDGDDFPADATRNYAIPPTNPFVNLTGDDEIWSYGLRNPWRNSFDRSNGDFWIGDVGQNAVEEIDVEYAGSAGGLNFGWKVEEGTNCFDNSQTGGNPACGSPVFTDPIHQYGHVGGPTGGFSVTGGYVYRGSVAQFQGLYFFADYVNNNFWTLDPYAVNPTASVVNRNSALLPNAGSVSGISSFGEDNQGELYVTSHSNGILYRVSSTAHTVTWDGAAATGNMGDGTNWGDPNNWTRGTTIDSLPLTGDEIRFPAAATPATVNLQTARSIGGLRFEGDYTLTGGSLNVLSGNINVSSGVTANLNTPTLAQSANASIRKLGTGRLNANNTLGQTVVLGGTLGGTGTVNNLVAYAGSTVAPGTSVGRLTITNDYRQRDGATLSMEIEGTTPATQHDQLAVGDQAFLNSVLDIVTGGSYVDPTTPGTLETFVLVTAADIEGTFDQIVYNGNQLVPTFGVDPTGSYIDHIDDGLFRIVTYTGTTMSLQNYAALPGDANGDRVVDGSDFGIWNTNKFTAGFGWLSGDFNGDDVVDGSDFGIWNTNKFTSVPDTLVPEPGSGAVLATALAGLLLRRRK